MCDGECISGVPESLSCQIAFYPLSVFGEKGHQIMVVSPFSDNTSHTILWAATSHSPAGSARSRVLRDSYMCGGWYMDSGTDGVKHNISLS